MLFVSIILLFNCFCRKGILVLCQIAAHDIKFILGHVLAYLKTIFA